MWTEGEEGGVGDASLNAGETCGGVEESSEELSGAASSESPEAEEKKRNDQIITARMLLLLLQKNKRLEKSKASLCLPDVAEVCSTMPTFTICKIKKGFLILDGRYKKLN